MNQASSTRKAILVIGMHRSGTSALTRGLEVLGVSLGTRLRSPRVENPKGFWEDLDFNAINTDVLQSVGVDWHTPDRIDPAALRSAKLAPLMSKAAAFLDQKFSTTGLIGLKDPRASRVLPFWDIVFERCGITTSYVIACRNPMSVAKSLAARDEFPAIKGHALWLEYMLCSLVHSAHRPRVMVDYDNMLEQPGRELSRIAKALNLSFDMNGPKFQEYKTQFLSNALRSTSYNVEDLNKCDTVPSFLKDTYTFINNIACDRISINDESSHDSISKFDILRSTNIDFLKNIIAESHLLKESLHNISVLERNNLRLIEEINSCKSKNILKYIFFRLKTKFLSLRDTKTSKSLRYKLLRHLNSVRLILANIKSASTLESLHHELFGLIKKHMFRNNKQK